MTDSYCDTLGSECSKLEAMTRERDKAVRQLAALQARYNALVKDSVEIGERREVGRG